ncbi:MAG: hypothetical protein N2319_07610 [Candidatus Kapabacteria bacterium]|nr:hypothetical protein [Candidatus Kapabacteria bacterium]
MEMGKYIKQLFILIFIAIIYHLSAFAQNLTVSVKSDTNNVLIGDQIKINLTVNSDEKTKIYLPVIPDTLGKIEVISRGKIDTVISDKNFTLKQNYIITSFDSGSFVFPSLTILYEKKGQTTLYPIQSDSLILNFNTIPVDTSQAIKDIKPPLEEPYTLADFIDYILIGLGVVAVAVLVIYLLKRRKKKEKIIQDYDPKIPPYLIALEDLKKLENEKLWQKGQLKKYYTLLTEIVRLYMERQFTIPALEMTSDEILQSLKSYKNPENKNIHFDNDLIKLLKTVFEIADMVKFAKYQSLPDENDLCMKNSVEFVKISAEIVKNSEKTLENSKKSDNNSKESA